MERKRGGEFERWRGREEERRRGREVERKRGGRRTGGEEESSRGRDIILTLGVLIGIGSVWERWRLERLRIGECKRLGDSSERSADSAGLHGDTGGSARTAANWQKSLLEQCLPTRTFLRPLFPAEELPQQTSFRRGHFHRGNIHQGHLGNSNTSLRIWSLLINSNTHFNSVYLTPPCHT